MPTPSEIAASLHPPRLPVEFAELTWQDASGAFGLGLLIGLFIYGCTRLILRRKETLAERAARELKGWQDLPGPERHYRQARLWVEISTFVHEGSEPEPPWREELYRPGAQPDCDSLDGEILALLRQRRRG